jgi:hypothetical protein
LLIVAAATGDELQLVVAVRSRVVPSEYVPVAVNCWVVPTTIAGFCGRMPSETSAAVCTVNVVDALTAPSVAEIVVIPVPELVASPWVPLLLLIVATVATEEAHITALVMFCELPSL